MAEERDFVIQTHGLSKSFGQVQALRSVDLKVPKGSIFGFLGPNGAGKTTFIKVLLGLSKPTEGTGTVFGRDIVTQSVAIRERIGYSPQQPRFIAYMTARENLAFAARFFFSGPEPRIQQRCAEMLALVGLEDKADRPIKSLSGGEKQRLGIALAQVNYPDLLILDEPASALDPLGRQEVLEVMERLRKQATIFYSTHILDDVQRVSDTVAILNHGRLAACGPIGRMLDTKNGAAYTITVRGRSEEVEDRLLALDWVTRASVTQRDDLCIWEVSVSDADAAEAHLLHHILGGNRVIVTEFRRKKVELEEAFMDIVNGDSYGR